MNTIIKGTNQRPMLTDIYYKTTQKAKPVVIFAHGFKGFKDWGAWEVMGKQFAEAGFVFLKFNFSHNGTTVEQPLDFADLEAFGNNNFSIELDDLGKIIDWVVTQKAGIPGEEIDTNQIYLIGHSRGGGAVITKAYEDQRIKKIVTWASIHQHFRNVSEDMIAHWKKEGVQEVFNGRTKQYMPLYWQLYANFEANKTRLDIPHAVKNLTIPFLIIHGTADPAVKYEAALAMHEWNPNTKLIPIEGGNHVFGTKHPWDKDAPLPADAQKVVSESIRFLKQ